MTRAHKIQFGGTTKRIRQFLCSRSKARFMMEYDIPKPRSIVVNGQSVRYEGP